MLANHLIANWEQNSAQEAQSNVSLIFPLRFDASLIYFLTEPRQHGIYLFYIIKKQKKKTKKNAMLTTSVSVL